MQMDITYSAALGFQYLMNAVAFNYTTLTCISQHMDVCVLVCLRPLSAQPILLHWLVGHPLYTTSVTVGNVLARVWLNHINAEAYESCFTAVFANASSRHPEFKVGGSLQGILLDWSDRALRML